MPVEKIHGFFLAYNHIIPSKAASPAQLGGLKSALQCDGRRVLSLFTCGVGISVKLLSLLLMLVPSLYYLDIRP